MLHSRDTTPTPSTEYAKLPTGLTSSTPHHMDQQWTQEEPTPVPRRRGGSVDETARAQYDKDIDCKIFDLDNINATQIIT